MPIPFHLFFPRPPLYCRSVFFALVQKYDFAALVQKIRSSMSSTVPYANIHLNILLNFIFDTEIAYSLQIDIFPENLPKNFLNCWQELEK